MYDETAGGSGLQQYFTDMLTDSDRNARYFHAIEAMIKEFARREGRRPVVLDAGCGTGLLTLFALVAGAERVIAVDTDRYHTDRLPKRLGAELARRVTVMHVQKGKNPFARKTPDPALAFDALVSELLGTFANSESASVYLRQYANHMRPHASRHVYVVPRKVTQTVRRCKLPSQVQDALRRRWPLEFAPTELLGYLYERTPPPYVGEPVLAREDGFDTLPFTVQQPRSSIPKGTYVAEWVAQLWGKGDMLQNTWAWASGHRADRHSRFARARAWGLMLFHTPTAAKINASPKRDSAMPHVRSEQGDFEVRADGREDERYDDLRYFVAEKTELWGDYYASLQKYLDWKLRRLDGARRKYDGKDLQQGFVSMRAIASGMPSRVPLRALYHCTLGAIVEALTEMGACKQWLQTLDVFGVLPKLFVRAPTSPYDAGVTLLPGSDLPKDGSDMTVGAGVLLACGKSRPRPPRAAARKSREAASKPVKKKSKREQTLDEFCKSLRAAGDMDEFEELLYQNAYYDVTLWKDALLRAGGDKSKVPLMRMSELQEELYKAFVGRKLMAAEVAAIGAESSDSDESDSDFEMVEDEEEEDEDDDGAYVEEDLRALLQDAS